MGSGAVSLDRIGQIRINVSDVDRAVRFYRDLLGMRLLFEVPEQGLAFFDCGGVRLYFAASEPGAGTQTAPIYYRVDGLDGVVEQLTQRGVAFDIPPQTVYRLEDVEGRMAFFRDSEGNTVALMEELPISPPDPS
jgi:catechol 2,3-dioxygenase-like lactoylglutathione lyase family enzyme